MNENCWHGIGHVALEPRVRDVNGKKAATFRIAVNRSLKKGNEWVDKTMFIDCDAWGYLAEKVETSLQVGTEVFVRGVLELDEWESDKGEKRSKHKIYVYQIFHNFNATLCI